MFNILLNDIVEMKAVVESKRMNSDNKKPTISPKGALKLRKKTCPRLQLSDELEGFWDELPAPFMLTTLLKRSKSSST